MYERSERGRLTGNVDMCAAPGIPLCEWSAS
jgi:hypothetical protein